MSGLRGFTGALLLCCAGICLFHGRHLDGESTTLGFEQKSSADIDDTGELWITVVLCGSCADLAG